MRSAHIYLRDDKTPAIVAAMHRNIAGIYYEQEDPIVVSAWREPDALPNALWAALKRYSVQDRNLRDAKRLEWPSYRASRCRSVREFESTYLCITVDPVNEAEIIFSAEAKPFEEDDITFRVIFQRSAEDIERAGDC